jgi:hypothetical protein
MESKKIENLVNDLNKTIKDINLIMDGMTYEERINNKPESLVKLSIQKNDIFNSLILISKENPISKDLLKYVNQIDMKFLIQNGLQFRLEGISVSKLNENHIQPILNVFKIRLDIQLFNRPILRSLRKDLIYQDLFDLKGKYPLSISDINNIESIYTLIIRFKLLKEISKIGKELFPKNYDSSSFESFYNDYVFDNIEFKNIFNQIYNHLEQADLNRYKQSVAEKADGYELKMRVSIWENLMKSKK